MNLVCYVIMCLDLWFFQPYSFSAHDVFQASDRLTEDIKLLFRALIGGALHGSPKAAAQEGGPIRIPRHVVIVGHSLGGAQAIRLAFQSHCLSDIVKLCGLVVVDMVEGSALQSLPYMKSALEQMPKHFDSIAEAVSWTVSSGMVRNPMSAEISVPPQLVKVRNLSLTHKYLVFIAFGVERCEKPTLSLPRGDDV